MKKEKAEKRGDEKTVLKSGHEWTTKTTRQLKIRPGPEVIKLFHAQLN